MAQAFNFELSFQSQALPLNARGQHQHGLMNARRFRIAGVNATGYVNLVVLTEHGNAQHSWNRGDSVVCQSQHQTVRSVPGESPDKRRADAITDLTCHLIDWPRELVVVAQKVAGGELVPIPERQVVDSDIGCVGNDLLVVSNSVFVGAKFLRIASGEADLADRGGPGWTITQRLNLRVLNEDRIGTQPIAGTDRAIQHVGVAHVAEVGLRVCRQWDFRPVLELHLERGHPGLFRDQLAGERITLVGPGVPFAPEAVHHRIHELDLRMTVEFGGQQLAQVTKRGLIRRVVVTWHAVIFLVAHFPIVALPLTFELYVGNLVDEKVRHTRLGRVRVFQLNSEPDALVIAPRQIERRLPVLRKVQPAWLFLDLTPVGTDVDLLRERQLDQILKSSRLGLARDVDGSS